MLNCQENSQDAVILLKEHTKWQIAMCLHTIMLFHKHTSTLQGCFPADCMVSQGRQSG